MAIDNKTDRKDFSIEYIVPQMVEYQKIDDLLENRNNTRPFFDTNEYLSIDKVLQEHFACIVGEPGIGKTRLVEEIRKLTSTKHVYYTASKFCTNNENISADKEYCIIDALDEVDGSLFQRVLLSIGQYKDEHPNVKVLFTCRKHYVASYANHFAACNNLKFIELFRLSGKDVDELIDKTSETTKKNVSQSSKLKELLSIPRYLVFLLEHENKQGACSNISELFEYIIERSIQTAIENSQIKNENIKILIQRVLEKVAFIMEISRKDNITKDELYSVLDGIKGNMAQMLISNIDLLFFENRILKETNGVLQFENTELQEYLAAKELCRQDNIESVLYDVAVQQKLKHIYTNWYDVIPHISYTEDRVHTFINVLKLIVSYESNLENEAFVSLLRYVDTSILSLHQKEELFSIVFDHYLRVPAYIMWRGPISELLQECYTSSCDVKLMLPSDKLNKIQLSNMYVILDALVEEGKLSECISEYWANAAKYLIQTDDNENKFSALNLYSALKCTTELIQLSESYNGFAKELKEKYCEITGYKQFVDKKVVDCWLDGCYESNPYAINAVLCIKDIDTIIYVYNKIITDGKLKEFFNPKGALFVHYEMYLKIQFETIWAKDPESKKMITKIIASFMENHSYATHNDINTIVKQILLEETTGVLFIKCFRDSWDLENLFRSFDAELVDFELLSSVEKLLKETNSEDWNVNEILIALVGKIRNDEAKRASVTIYISRYAETFERWDKAFQDQEDKKINSHDQQLMKANESLSDLRVSKSEKYEAVFELSKDIVFVQRQDLTQSLVNVIANFFDEIDLDKMILEKTSENSFSLSKSLMKIPYYVKAIYRLGVPDSLKSHRDILAKTLPIVCCTTNLDACEIREIYRSVIGSFSEEEKAKLVEWWKSRKDDFMNISSEDVFTCITDYGIDELSYKLEEYIEQYITYQDLNHSIAASKALEIISKGYCNWGIHKYKTLFDELKDDSITSIKMQCNAIMIEKFKDSDAIIWRIEYLKNNVVQSLNNNTGHVRAISHEESEMISQNPRMFRCFMSIIGNEVLEKQLLELFDFGLSLTIKKETQEYAGYILRQIYFLFVNTNSIHYISDLRKKVETFNAKNINYLANNIMNSFEMIFLKNEKVNIAKAIRQYNKCTEESHLEIRNDGDLRRYFTYIQTEVQKEIQDQGIYSLVRQDALSEDFIQRELKNTIINKCCQMGLNVEIDREVALQDNKRTDLLIRYGLCNPIMVELKLLHNKEIQNKNERKEYKNKFAQYTNATNACLSVFWIFNVHRKGGEFSNFEALKAEYKDLNNTLVLYTDCKCSSGFETGLPKLKNPRTTRSKKTKGKK